MNPLFQKAQHILQRPSPPHHTLYENISFPNPSYLQISPSPSYWPSPSIPSRKDKTRKRCIDYLNSSPAPRSSSDFSFKVILQPVSSYPEKIPLNHYPYSNTCIGILPVPYGTGLCGHLNQSAETVIESKEGIQLISLPKIWLLYDWQPSPNRTPSSHLSFCPFYILFLSS